MSRRYAAIAAAAALAATAAGVSAGPARAHTLPNITSTQLPAIIAATEENDWPHASTLPERMQLAGWVLRRYAGRGVEASGDCWFREPFGRGYCRLNITTHGTIRINWRAWEDGSVRAWRNLR